MAHRFQWTRNKRSEHYGQKAEIKIFYENVVDADNAPHWVEWAPPMIPRAKRDRWEGYAIQEYRKCNDLWDPTREQNFVLSHIRILSPLLRKRLQPLLEPYGISFSDNHCELHAPLQPLLWERHTIQQLHDTATDQEKVHFAILLGVMQAELRSTLEEIEDLDEQSQITHRLLWTLFPRGTVVVQPLPEGHQIYRALRVMKIPEADTASGSIRVSCEYIRFDGVCYGTRSVTLEIPYFHGRREIATLPVFPVKRLGDSYVSVVSRMVERGRLVLEYQDVHYMRYLGTAPEGSEQNSGSRKRPGGIWDEEGQSRIIIDFQLSRKHGNTPKTTMLQGYFNGVASDSGPEPTHVATRPGNRSKRRWLRSTQNDYDDVHICADCGKARQKLDRTKSDSTPLRRLTVDERERNINTVSRDHENLMLLDPYLDGFSLSSKQWQSFNVERVQALNLNSDAFGFLVHAEENKSLVCAVVENHAEHSLISRDIIAGKGQGLLILLSGSPGTGKTLMAEAIADKTRRPLLYIDARDLGTPDEIERSLSRIMEDASAWNAILLLDEADVYLQKRSSDSLDRNKIVAVFLRLLEYYKGIMFLTTNLWETVDEAVESRIQIHLRFPDLDHASRSQIWQKFLMRSEPGTHTLSNEEISRIGEWVINGRQIRNVLRMGEAWSMQINKPLDFEMFEKVIPASCPKAYKERNISPQDGQGVQANTISTNCRESCSVERCSRALSDRSIDLLMME